MKVKQLTLIYLSAALFFFSIIPAFASSEYSLSIHNEISNLQDAKSPEFIDNQILFTYYGGNKYIRRVAIAFDADNYKSVYPFMKNEFNVFFLARNIPENTQYLNYRLIVDGVWMDDPKNNNSILNSEHLRVSSIKIPKKYNEQTDTPIIEKNKNVRFVFRDHTNKHIFLSGNFNNWDPFMLKMKEDSKDPGTYTISLRLPSGKHYYNFISDGTPMQDPNNPKKAYGPRGNPVSIIVIN